jgi:hypothetical protein
MDRVYSNTTHALHEDVNSSVCIVILWSYYLHREIPNVHMGHPVGFRLELSMSFYGTCL